jgi:hypothetical protein
MDDPEYVEAYVAQYGSVLTPSLPAREDRPYPEWWQEQYKEVQEIIKMVNELHDELGKALSPDAESAFRDWVFQLVRIADSIQRPEVELGAEVISLFFELACMKAVAFNQACANFFPAIKREAKYVQEGVERGHAAYSSSWLDHWDDAWAERRENGKGWKVGNKAILAALPDNVPVPDRSTITRQRERRHKELNA